MQSSLQDLSSSHVPITDQQGAPFSSSLTLRLRPVQSLLQIDQELHSPLEHPNKMLHEKVDVNFKKRIKITEIHFFIFIFLFVIILILKKKGKKWSKTFTFYRSIQKFEYLNPIELSRGQYFSVFNR